MKQLMAINVPQNSRSELLYLRKKTGNQIGASGYLPHCV